MGIGSYFLDTYALFEIVSGSPAYMDYVRSKGIMTSILNLMELYYGMLKKYGEKAADDAYRSFLGHVVQFDSFIMKEAMLFRLKNRRKNLSYVDCMGYIMARVRAVPFVTGDVSFKGVDGVIFIK